MYKNNKIIEFYISRLLFQYISRFRSSGAAGVGVGNFPYISTSDEVCFLFSEKLMKKLFLGHVFEVAERSISAQLSSGRLRTNETNTKI